MSNPEVTQKLNVKEYALLTDFSNKCPRCDEKLTYDTGQWYCEYCEFYEYNNVIQCRECQELYFGDYKERFGEYCEIKHPEGGSCRDMAIGESEQAYYEDLQIREHIKSCNDENCQCRNY
jgi:hypothetical protein